MNLHTATLIEACQKNGYSYEIVDTSQTLVKVTKNQKPYYFIATETPFNSQDVVRIVDDKSFTTQLLSNVLAMPKTISYIDPHASEMYQPFARFNSISSIATDIQNHFSWPVIIKPNSGSQGKNVSIINNEQSARQALEDIYNHQTPDYDHVALVQEKIDIKREFRVTVLRQKIVLIYEKVFQAATFTGNVSPLHWEGASANIQTDQELLDKIDDFIRPLFQLLPLEYGGLDIAFDTTGKLWLFEINHKPAYNKLVADEGTQPLLKIFSKMLESL